MKITKRQLRQLIREEADRVLDECPSDESQMPCPIRTAAEMQSAGATGEDVLHWVQLLISEFTSGAEVTPPEEVMIEPEVLGMLPGDEAFGMGLE